MRRAVSRARAPSRSRSGSHPAYTHIITSGGVPVTTGHSAQVHPGTDHLGHREVAQQVGGPWPRQ